MEIKANIREKLSRLPQLPGVYLMHDKSGKVIYVGKAKILKNRVPSYFRSFEKLTPKTQALVMNIADFEYVVTDSEVEALILECNLIKKYSPHYNILLKDDKTYPYLKITMQEDYPRIMLSRKMENDGARYFGPYASAKTVYEMIDIVKKVFMIPTCRKQFPKEIGKGRPCLNYHINQCMGVCDGHISKEEYRQTFYEIERFMDGKKDEITASLTAKMNECAEKLEFEKAAEYRNKIISIGKVSEKQKMASESMEDVDVVSVASDGETAFCEMFFVREGRMTGHDSFRLNGVDGKGDSEIIADFIKQFYSSNDIVPKQIHLKCDIEDKEVIEEWLSTKRGNRVYINVPQRGEKAHMVALAGKNARRALEEFLLARMSRNINSEVLEELKGALGLDFMPNRIESYDISSISGTDKVGAMVVFEGGKPKKSEYRKFKIKWVEGNDDYASTKEMLYRRFKHALDEIRQVSSGEMDEADTKFMSMPDLILLDGGVGHMHTALELFEEIGITPTVFGMVKDDNHRTRGLINVKGEELHFAKNSVVFKFLTQIQDEVHRFAITYHKNTRSKTMVKSELEEIKGVGEKKRKLLLKHFGGITAIRKATLDELEAVKGIDKNTAKNIYYYFKNE